jgi:acyl-CoA reductase-like NAD-dependent aldehyde dehydrogenase
VLTLPPIRFGKPYESLEFDDVVHFDTGEPIAKIGVSNGAMLTRDMRNAQKARDALRQFSCRELIERCKKAGELFSTATLPMGNGTQSPEEFVHAQSASTGLPEHMCQKNMVKNAFVLGNMDKILDSLTRGLDLEILSRGYGEEGRGVTVSYQATTPVLGAVLPSNSPGVHTLWLPAIPMQIGLVLKPGSSEPWTPYRMYYAYTQAGIPAEAIALYPGRGNEVGAALLSSCQRSMIFGSAHTVEQYAGNPRVQPHGPGWSKILIGDDVVDQWEKYLDVMIESIYSNGGRSCINASAVFASRHTKEIAEALASKLGPIEVKKSTDPEAGLAAFTTPGMAKSVWQGLEKDLSEPGVTDLTSKYGPRLVEQERCAYLRPVIALADSPDREIVKKEYMFPFATVVQCPQNQMLQKIGPTLVGTVITKDEAFARAATDCTHIDRLNVGPVPTNKLNWLQPHEGNITDFLFRSRAYQTATP